MKNVGDNNTQTVHRYLSKATGVVSIVERVPLVDTFNP